MLSPLLWLALTLLVGIVACVALRASGLVVVTLIVFLGAVLAVALCMYVYFATKGQSHQLRSETYALAIERGLVGDDVRGLSVRSGTDVSVVAPDAPTAVLVQGRKDEADGD